MVFVSVGRSVAPNLEVKFTRDRQSSPNRGNWRLVLEIKISSPFEHEAEIIASIVA